MKIPVNCPICNIPFINTYHHKSNEILIKSCIKKLSHQLSIFVSNKNDLIESINLVTSSKECVWWHWSDNTITLYKQLSGSPPPVMKLPWFEPEFSNYPKLLIKLRTYITFS